MGKQKKKDPSPSLLLVSVGELAEWLTPYGEAVYTTRQVQNLENEGVVVKAGRGKYDLKGSIQRRLRQLEQRRNESPLVRRQIENLEIKTARDRLELLREYGVLTQDDALAHELVPVLKAFQVGMRELRSTLAKEFWEFARTVAPAVMEGKLGDQEGIARVQELLAKPIDERLNILASLGERRERKKEPKEERHEQGHGGKGKH